MTCACVISKTVRVRSSYRRSLKSHGKQLDGCLVYYPDGHRIHHVAELPDDFRTYMQKFSSKTRNTLRRKLKPHSGAFASARS